MHIRGVGSEGCGPAVTGSKYRSPDGGPGEAGGIIPRLRI